MALFEQKAPAIMSGLVRDLAITDYQAGGILGNIGWECGGFENLAQIHGTAYGWPQWDGSRRDAFFKWCAAQSLDRWTDEANYRYLVKELLSTEGNALKMLRTTKTVDEASDNFEHYFERAGVPALAGRRSFAHRAMAAYAASDKKPISFGPSPSPRKTMHIAGDSIAMGLAGVLGGATSDAKVGISSAQIIARVRSADYLVVSAGSNDATNPQLAANLEAIRAKATGIVIWILPAVLTARTVVAQVALKHGDKTVSFDAGADDVHPKSYQVLGDAVMAVVRGIEAKPQVSDQPPPTGLPVGPPPKLPPRLPDDPGPVEPKPAKPGFFDALIAFIKALFRVA